MAAEAGPALSAAPAPAAPERRPARPRRASPRRPSLRRLVLRLPLLLALLAVAGFLWFLDAAAAPPAEPMRRTDGIVVLTGGADRVGTGLRLLAAGGAGVLLVSGAHPDATLADLAAAAELPVGPLQGRVTLGRTARSTRGNAQETAAWAGPRDLGSLRVVTAGYHMPRALVELRRALPPGVVLVPHPVMPARLRDAAAPSRWRTWTLLVGEYAKLIGAVLGLSATAEGAPGRA